MLFTVATTNKKFLITCGEDESGILKTGDEFRTRPLTAPGNHTFKCEINFLKGSVEVAPEDRIEIVKADSVSTISKLIS